MLFVKPNDKIYFGGKQVVYQNVSFTAEDIWFTTDFGILKSMDYHDAGYRFKAKYINFETDKQIPFKNLNLYVGNFKLSPVSFPWLGTKEINF